MTAQQDDEAHYDGLAVIPSGPAVQKLRFGEWTVGMKADGKIGAKKDGQQAHQRENDELAQALFARIVELDTPTTGPVQLFREVPLVIDFLSKETLYYGGNTPVEQDAERELLAAVANRYSLQQGNWSYVIRNDDGTFIHRNGDIVVSFNGNLPSDLEDAMLIAQSMNKRAGYTT